MATEQQYTVQAETQSPSTSIPTMASTENQNHTQTQPANSTPLPDTLTTTKTAAGVISHSKTSSIEVTTRDDLSLLYRLIRFIIKPIRPNLVRPPKTPFPEGSPRLDPPTKRNIVIKESKFEGIWMYHMHAQGPDQPKQGRLEREQASEGSVDMLPKSAGGATTQHANLNDKTLTPSNSRGVNRTHRVYYFSGGGFQSPPSGEHWRFLAQLTQDLAGHRSSVTFPVTQRVGDPESDAKIEMIMVSYPLAPKMPASESLRLLRIWLGRLMDQAVRDGETLSLMGDSSGANVAVSLGFWAVENYRSPTTGQQQHVDSQNEGSGKSQREAQRRHFPLVSVVTISGPMDLTNSSPELAHTDTLDVVLTAKLTLDVANMYCGQNEKRSSKYVATPLSSPEVSPLFQPDASFRAWRDKGVNIHGVYGTHDVLAPSGMDFLKKCQELGMKGKWLVWEGQMHCFPLAGGGDSLGIREGRDARYFVETVLRGDAEMED